MAVAIAVAVAVAVVGAVVAVGAALAAANTLLEGTMSHMRPFWKGSAE